MNEAWTQAMNPFGTGGSFPRRNAVMQIRFLGSPVKSANWWFIFSGIDTPDVGPIDPNLDVDLYLETTLPALTKVWLGE